MISNDTMAVGKEKRRWVSKIIRGYNLKDLMPDYERMRKREEE